MAFGFLTAILVQTDWLAQHKQHRRKGRARRGLYLVLVLKFMVLVAFCIASHNSYSQNLEYSVLFTQAFRVLITAYI